jgi:hypothetical protein
MGGNADTGMMDLSGPQGGGVAFSRALGRRKEKSRQPARREQGYARTLLYRFLKERKVVNIKGSYNHELRA